MSELSRFPGLQASSSRWWVEHELFSTLLGKTQGDEEQDYCQNIRCRFNCENLVLCSKFFFHCFPRWSFQIIAFTYSSICWPTQAGQCSQLAGVECSPVGVQSSISRMDTFYQTKDKSVRNRGRVRRMDVVCMVQLLMKYSQFQGFIIQRAECKGTSHSRLTALSLTLAGLTSVCSHLPVSFFEKKCTKKRKIVHFWP